jgi:hypothetical protein
LQASPVQWQRGQKEKKCDLKSKQIQVANVTNMFVLHVRDATITSGSALVSARAMILSTIQTATTVCWGISAVSGEVQFECV